MYSESVAADRFGWKADVQPAQCLEVSDNRGCVSTVGETDTAVADGQLVGG